MRHSRLGAQLASLVGKNVLLLSNVYFFPLDFYVFLEGKARVLRAWEATFDAADQNFQQVVQKENRLIQEKMQYALELLSKLSE